MIWIRKYSESSKISSFSPKNQYCAFIHRVEIIGLKKKHVTCISFMLESHSKFVIEDCIVLRAPWRQPSTVSSYQRTEFPPFSVEDLVLDHLELPDRQQLDQQLRQHDFYLDKELRVLSGPTSHIKVAEGTNQTSRTST